MTKRSERFHKGEAGLRAEPDATGA